MDGNKKYSFLKATIEKAPWKEFFLGFFIPMNLMYFLFHLGKPLAGIMADVIWCIAVILINYIAFRKIQMFAVTTCTMTLIGFFISFLRHHPVLYLIAEALDNSVMGIIFLVTLLFQKPFILYFLEEETVNKIPEKIRNSSYYLKAWKIITAVWGISYVGTALILLYLRYTHSEITETVDFYTTWPMVMALLIFSINFPYIYWTKNSNKMEAEGKK